MTVMTGRFVRMLGNTTGPQIMAQALFASTSMKLAIVCIGLDELRDRYREYAMAEIVAVYFYRRIEKNLVVDNKLLPFITNDEITRGLCFSIIR